MRPPIVQCSGSEDPATLDYANAIQGRNELTLWVILADGRTMDSDVTRALRGSGKSLELPSSGSDKKPIRLLIRRSLQSTEWGFVLQSIGLRVMHADAVVLQVLDSRTKVSFEQTVSHKHLLSYLDLGGGVVFVVVSGVGLINEVNRHWARLVLGCVTVCGHVNHLGM